MGLLLDPLLDLLIRERPGSKCCLSFSPCRERSYAYQV